MPSLRVGPPPCKVMGTLLTLPKELTRSGSPVDAQPGLLGNSSLMIARALSCSLILTFLPLRKDWRKHFRIEDCAEGLESSKSGFRS